MTERADPQLIPRVVKHEEAAAFGSMRRGAGGLRRAESDDGIRHPRMSVRVFADAEHHDVLRANRMEDAVHVALEQARACADSERARSPDAHAIHLLSADVAGQRNFFPARAVTEQAAVGRRPDDA